jgi:hypothetical protein
MPTVRKGAEAISRREGVSLNQFINVAVAEKLAHLEHDEWLSRRPQLTAAKVAQALQFLDRVSPNAPTLDDQLPEGYVSVKGTAEYKQAIQGRITMAPSPPSGELPTSPTIKKGERRIGLYKGQIDIGPEFFAPLPEEELALWNCEGDEPELQDAL